ncbi:hypothetical protein DFP74_3535 [Nocardiopsis sp. Huas11]|nr:hypothetical protein DFP74_3535 [Nocardiopsis sp. Huas11]
MLPFAAQIAARVDSKAFQRAMGHASITETFDNYGRLFSNRGAGRSAFCELRVLSRLEQTRPTLARYGAGSRGVREGVGR